MEKQTELDISDLVKVNALGTRFGHRGRVVNRFTQNRPLYAVQFPDNCVGSFERSELEKIQSSEAATDWEKGLDFHDVTESQTRYQA